MISFVSSGISLVELYHVMLAAGLAPLTFRIGSRRRRGAATGSRKRQVDDVVEYTAERTYPHPHGSGDGVMREGVKVNLIIQIYSIYLPFGTQSLKDEMSEKVSRKTPEKERGLGTKGKGRLTADWFPLTWHCSKTLVPCTV